jgi:hypothetical protein
VNNELEKMQKKTVMAPFKYYPSTCLKRSRKITKTSIERAGLLANIYTWDLSNAQ